MWGCSPGVRPRTRRSERGGTQEGLRAPAGRARPLERWGQSPTGVARTALGTRLVLRRHTGRQKGKRGDLAARQSGRSGSSPGRCCGRQPLYASPWGRATTTWASVHTITPLYLAEGPNANRCHAHRTRKAPSQPRGRRDTWHIYRGPQATATAPPCPRTLARPSGTARACLCHTTSTTRPDGHAPWSSFSTARRRVRARRTHALEGTQPLWAPPYAGEACPDRRRLSTLLISGLCPRRRLA